MSESDWLNFFVGVAAISGAFLGIFVAALLSRASATSALRQDWINSLRVVLSDFLTYAEKWIDIPDKNSQEAYNAKIELMGYVHKAKLYLNENELNSQNLMSKMERLTEKYSNVEHASKKYQAEKHVLSSLMQEILKEEWNRVRDGEILWSINKFFKLLRLPKWFYITRIRIFWLIIFTIITWIIFELYVFKSTG